MTALQGIRDRRSEQAGKVAELYYRSIKQYRAGQLVEAREGLRQVLDAGYGMDGQLGFPQERGKFLIFSSFHL